MGVVGIGLALTVGACGTTTSSGAGGATVSPAPSESQPVGMHADPATLVASWRVQADGEEPGAVLTIGDRVDGGVILWRECGGLDGDWRANREGLLLVALSGGDGDCFADTQQDPTDTWLHDVARFAADGTDMLLLDETGRTVATLRPGGKPTAGPNRVPEYAAPPVVNAAVERHYAEAASLPDDLEPATAADIRGRWVPVGDNPPPDAYVAFTPDGDYTGSDGCNGVSGRYVVGGDGALLATSGASTQIGCHNSPISGWPAQAGRVALKGIRLVFVAPDGHVLGSATRS